MSDCICGQEVHAKWCLNLGGRIELPCEVCGNLTLHWRHDLQSRKVAVCNDCHPQLFPTIEKFHGRPIPEWAKRCECASMRAELAEIKRMGRMPTGPG